MARQAWCLVVLDVQAHVLSPGRAVIVVAVLAAVCACRDAMPPSPAEVAAETEARQAERLRAHVLRTPGVAEASVLVAAPATDPLARAPAPGPARVAIVVTTTPGADTGIIGDAAIAAARTTFGADADLQVQVVPPPASTRLVDVGPFRVAESSRRAVAFAIAIALLVIGGLAAGLAWTLYRRGIKPHQSSTSTTRGS